MKQITLSSPTRVILTQFFSDRGNEIALAGRILTMADDGLLRALKALISFGAFDETQSEILRDINKIRDILEKHGAVLIVKGRE